jgi:Allantoicase repeat
VVWPNNDLFAAIVESRINGDTRNPFEVNPTRRWSHVRLQIYPDDGMARLRLSGRLTDEGLRRFTLGIKRLASCSEGRWFVAFGDMVVVEAAFGLDSALPVVRARVSGFGHHRGAIHGVIGFRLRGQFGGVDDHAAQPLGGQIFS